MNSFFHRVQTIEVKLESHSFSPPSPSEEAPRAGFGGTVNLITGKKTKSTVVS
jgi:hypothetical protein